VSTELSTIEGAYLRDILDQPQALQETLSSLESSKPLASIAAKLLQGSFRVIVLTGMGSSFHALHPASIEFIHQGLVALMVETSELVHYRRRLFSPDTLIIAVSQSGQSAEMVRLLDSNSGKSPVIAVTNTAGSPLAQLADATILTRAGSEFSVSCKTYLTALMALQWLADVLCQRDLESARQQLQQAASLVQTYLRDWEQHVQKFLRLLQGTRHLFLVGRGASLAAVGAGALIVKESDHFHAEGMSSAAFRHGPLEMLSEETFVLVFAGDGRTRDLNQRLFEDIREQHGRSELVADDAKFAPCRLPSSLPSIQPILEILPVQMITLALAARAGREPGRFELASKVTTRE
jgi:glutamine---fructose-6-phosphate transaminase (isomerizing)